MIRFNSPKKTITVLLNIICLLTFLSLEAIQEKDFFPVNQDKYEKAVIWKNSKGELCAMWACEIIIIDSWHYPDIEDDYD